MMGTWDLPKQTIVPPVDLASVEVLVEYDGPQIVMARALAGSTLLLGVASDEDTAHVRWIYAPITTTERAALLAGATTLREALLKPAVYVLDVDRADGVRAAWAWECDSAGIDTENLPMVGALLPRATREAHRTPNRTEPAFSLDRPGGLANGVGFNALAAVLAVVQRLWTAIAEARAGLTTKVKGAFKGDIADLSELALGAASGGSLVLRVNPAEPTMFADVASQYEELVRAADDQAQLVAVLDRLGPRVGDRYDELLRVLATHDLQLFTQRGDHASFVASHSTERIRAALPRALAGQPENVDDEGHFVAFDSRGLTFEFAGKDGRYQGPVSPDVVRDHDDVVVGVGARYAVRTAVTSGKTRIVRLVALTLVARSPEPPPG